MIKIKKQSSNLGTAWEMIIIDTDHSKELARYRHTEADIDKAIRSMRYTINKHIANGGTLYNYQW